MSMDPLLEVRVVDGSVEEFLESLGEVFVVHRGHDSGNTSYGVRIGGHAWFVKHAEDDEPISHLESAIVFHAAVRHPAIIPLVGWFRTSAGLAIVYEFQDGLIVNDPLAPGALPRQHPESTYARFRRLPVDEIIRALDAVHAAHVAVANAGFVAVDFYDGAIIYDFEHRQVHLCDLARIGLVPTGSIATASMARRASWLRRSSSEARPSTSAPRCSRSDVRLLSS